MFLSLGQFNPYIINTGCKSWKSKGGRISSLINLWIKSFFAPIFSTFREQLPLLRAKHKLYKLSYGKQQPIIYELNHKSTFPFPKISLYLVLSSKETKIKFFWKELTLKEFFKQSSKWASNNCLTIPIQQTSISTLFQTLCLASLSIKSCLLISYCKVKAKRIITLLSNTNCLYEY